MTTQAPSPGCTGPGAIKAMDLRIIVSVSGTDDALSATVGSRKTYFAHDVRWASFAPAIDEDADGVPRVDLTRLSALADL